MRPNKELQDSAIQHQMHLQTIDILGKLIQPNSSPSFVAHIESILVDITKPFKAPTNDSKSESPS